MAWIESHQELWQHPKTRKLSRLLGISVPAAVGHLHGLWYWALSYAQDGVISRFDAEEISDAVLWDGDPQAFVDALVSSGYADSTQEGIELHDWYEYAGKLMDKRECQKVQARLRKQRQRTQQETEIADSSDHVTRDTCVTVRDMSRCHAPTNQPTNNNPPIAPKGESDAQKRDIQEQRFTEFWRRYPKKVGKAAALKAWKKIHPDADLFSQILRKIDEATSCEQWQRDGGRFIPNPATWLNQGRWDDEMEKPPETEVSSYADVV